MPPASRLSTPSGSIAYSRAGNGPALLLVHGLGGTRSTWRAILPGLATCSTVIAPDLPGHGDSDAPLGDYSPGGQASALRDVVLGLGIERATVVGHSLGGGIAMQFAYQFPERTERLVLISSGGLGAEVTPLLRAATLPGAETALATLSLLPTGITRHALAALSLGPGLVAREDTEPLVDALHTMNSPRERRTFVRTARTVLDLSGQSVSAAGTFSILSEMPVMIAWGAKDKTIPPHHHRALAHRLPHARACEIPDAGHFPQETKPLALTQALLAFLASSDPYDYDEDRWRSRAVPGASVDGPC